MSANIITGVCTTNNKKVMIYVLHFGYQLGYIPWLSEHYQVLDKFYLCRKHKRQSIKKFLNVLSDMAMTIKFERVPGEQ